MKKYKIAVYAITKNEEKHVDRWVPSMSEADAIYVLDTASTDKTVEKLKKYSKVHVTTKKYDPWRFDQARNDSLNLVPEDFDICVCTDLDEVFEKGWRQKLEECWKKDTTRLQYNYNWSFDENNHPQVTYYLNKMHTKNYEWKDPVHEYLVCKDNTEHSITTDEIVLNHYPDKEKSRTNYLPLLELAVKENPNDERHLHYLGREYMYYERWNEAIDMLLKHVKIAHWKEEKSASMRFIARCHINLNRYDEANLWLEKAIKETPYLRDPYIEKALLAYRNKDYKEIKNSVLEALKITKNENKYINEPYSWNETPYDLISLAYYYDDNDLEKSLEQKRELLENYEKENGYHL